MKVSCQACHKTMGTDVKYWQSNKPYNYTLVLTGRREKLTSKMRIRWTASQILNVPRRKCLTLLQGTIYEATYVLVKYVPAEEILTQASIESSNWLNFLGKHCILTDLAFISFTIHHSRDYLSCSHISQYSPVITMMRLQPLPTQV